MSQRNNHIGRALYSTTNSNLLYPILAIDWVEGVFKVEDLDTGAEINWFPGTCESTCKDAFKIFGFEIGDYDGD